VLREQLVFIAQSWDARVLPIAGSPAKSQDDPSRIVQSGPKLSHLFIGTIKHVDCSP
jgi:hypothetical protein